MAAARRVAGRQLHPAPWPCHPWPRHPALRGSHVTWLAGRVFCMSERGGILCSHCLLPVGVRAMQRKVNGESHAFCCYGCCIAFQVKNGKSEEWEAAWLLIRLGVGAFLSMNIMLFSLLLYAGAFTGVDARLLPWIHLLLWVFATPALIILGGPFLAETWRDAVDGRVTSSALIVLGVGAAYLYSAFAVIERGPHVYFDTATMVLMLFTVGRYLEAAGRARAARNLEPLLAAESECATVVDDNGRKPPRAEGRRLPGYRRQHQYGWSALDPEHPYRDGHPMGPDLSIGSRFADPAQSDPSSCRPRRRHFRPSGSVPRGADGALLGAVAAVRSGIAHRSRRARDCLPVCSRSCCPACDLARYRAVCAARLPGPRAWRARRTCAHAPVRFRQNGHAHVGQGACC